jgi:heptosyltransferase III
MKILVVQIGKIGDMVITTPLFRAIHQEIPDAHIHVLLSRRGAPVVADNPHIKKIILYRKNPFRLFFLFIRLYFTRYDFLIDPKDHFSTESAIFARISRAAVKVGFNKPGAGKKVFSHPLPSQEENFSLHCAARNLLPLGFLGISTPFDIKPELFPNSILQSKMRERYVLDGAAIILLNLSTGDPCRRWKMEKWSAVAGFCIEGCFQVFLSFQPSDSAMAQEIHAKNPKVVLFRSESIREVIALMPHVRLVVTPDTSIVHIASAFNIPQVALFPRVEWNLNKFRPLSDQSIVLEPSEGAALASIRTEDVVEAMRNLLQSDAR